MYTSISAGHRDIIKSKYFCWITDDFKREQLMEAGTLRLRRIQLEGRIQVLWGLKLIQFLGPSFRKRKQN